MKIKNIKGICLVLALSAFFFINVKAQIVTGVKLDQGTITLGVDSTKNLTAIVFPPDAADKSVEWTIIEGISKIDTVITNDTICTITGKDV
ncbi:MAG: Ig-like domain-containing protein, partial [Tannerella sp.]|nr:Ig-like domain-containing protein [Tannerella sp.]